MELYNYKCEMCKKIIPSNQNKEELMEEYIDKAEETFASHNDLSIVCDNCFIVIAPKKHPFNVATAKMNTSKIKE